MTRLLHETGSIAFARIRSIRDGHISKEPGSQILIDLGCLQSLDSMITITATERPDSIDLALLRSGRFERPIEMRLPDELALARRS